MVGVSLVLAAATGAIAQATATTGPTSRTIEVTARFSAFTPEALVVEAGTHVTFVIDNADPIAHEFIVGDEDLHRRHATGTEVWHAPRPGEVSIPAGGRAETTWRFDRPGTVAFGCHLPGHWAYGMSGVITVV
ncbi:MAG: cupredoxin domain-containing protein [Acidimicrobiales bacterium]